MNLTTHLLSSVEFKNGWSYTFASLHVPSWRRQEKLLLLLFLMISGLNWLRRGRNDEQNKTAVQVLHMPVHADRNSGSQKLVGTFLGALVKLQESEY